MSNKKSRKKKMESMFAIKRYTVRDNLVSFLIALVMGSMFAVMAYMSNDRNFYHLYEQVKISKMEITEQKEEQNLCEKPEEPISSLRADTFEVAFEEPVVSEEDVQLLARLMYAEEGILLRTEGYEKGKRAHLLCGSVVLHRLESHHQGTTTLEEVIYGGGYAKQTVERIKTQAAPEEVVEWARELLTNGPIGPENLVYQSEFLQGCEIYEKIGNQYFCLK